MDRQKTSCCGFRISFTAILIFILAPVSLLVTYNLAPAYLRHPLVVPPAALCRDVLSNMLIGRWDQRHMASQEVDRMRTFYRIVREKQYHMPKGAQRADKRCGNVAQGRSGELFYFKALCDPDGHTPCCYKDHVCRNRSVQECKCTGCEDMRTPVHAEYATWRTLDPACQPRGKWSVEAICSLLRNSTLYFVGDSLMRHVFTAFLLAARGNSETGVFLSTMPAELRSQCSGLYTFTETKCRKWLDRNVTLCNGSATAKMFELWSVNHSKAIQEAVLSLTNTTTLRSLALVGIGLHWNMDASRVISLLLRPLLQTMESQRLTRPPRLIWASVHQMGMLKTPMLASQSNRGVRAFNGAVESFLRAHHVPVFDMYNLTHNVTSYDGTHYGYGINGMKVNILLHYLEESRALGKW